MIITPLLTFLLFFEDMENEDDANYHSNINHLENS